MKKSVSLLCFALFLSSCAEFGKKVESDWSQKMQGLAGSYNQLLPLMFDDDLYAHPKNEKKVKRNLQNIVEDSNAISNHIGDRLSGSDPFFKLGLKQLRQTAKGALESYDAKEFTYSQQLVQNSLNYCFKCHTRTAGGTEFIEWSNFNLPDSLSPMQKSRALIATRQFTKANKILENYIYNTPPDKEEDFLDAVKYYLVISLRRHSSPENAQTMLRRFKKSRYSSKMSKRTKSLISTWDSSLTNWISSRKRNKDLTVKMLLEKNITFGTDPDFAFANSLRQSLVLHNGLPKAKDYYEKAKIYHKLGKIYSRHPELGFWDLPDLYFETCINLVPYSDISRQCYYSLEKRLTESSALKGDLVIPRKNKEYLLRLKVLTRKNPVPGSPSSNY